jgi:hypothetical protein
MDAGPGDRLLTVASRLRIARLEFDAQTRRLEDNRARLQETFDQLRKGRPQREMLRDSAFARMQAKIDTMPVIEQAKGILMAQNRCGPEEAFDLLRRASQRANIKVSVLAAQIVAQVASHESLPAPSLPRPASGGGVRETTRDGRPSSGRPGTHSASGPRDHALAGNRDLDSGSRPRRAGGRSDR